VSETVVLCTTWLEVPVIVTMAVVGAGVVVVVLVLVLLVVDPHPSGRMVRTTSIAPRMIRKAHCRRAILAPMARSSRASGKTYQTAGGLNRGRAAGPSGADAEVPGVTMVSVEIAELAGFPEDELVPGVTEAGEK
jgi:CDP-diglyceride synthetase